MGVVREKKTPKPKKSAGVFSTPDASSVDRRKSGRAASARKSYADRDDSDDDKEMWHGVAEWEYTNEDGTRIARPATESEAEDEDAMEVDEEAEEEPEEEEEEEETAASPEPEGEKQEASPSPEPEPEPEEEEEEVELHLPHRMASGLSHHVQVAANKHQFLHHLQQRLQLKQRGQNRLRRPKRSRRRRALLQSRLRQSLKERHLLRKGRGLEREKQRRKRIFLIWTRVNERCLHNCTV